MDINGMSSSLVNNDTLAIQPPRGQEITGGREVDGNQGNNVEMHIVMNHQHDAGNSSGSNKQRKRRSKVWDEMIKFAGVDGTDCARCIHCEKVFDGSSKKGTTHLNNHLETCRRKRNNNGGEDADKSIDPRRNFTSSAVIEGKSVTDLLKSCFLENGDLNSEYFNPSVLNSRMVEILQIYEEEKEKLRMVLSQTSCRFNLLIVDFEKWHILIVCYIDNNWESKMKIISVDDAFEDGKREHNYQNLVKFLRQSCSDMKIDGSICSISYHCWGHPDFNLFNKSDYEDVIGEIESEFSQRDIPHPFLGFLFPLDIVNLIRYNFEDNLEKWIWNKFDGIRKCIDYVNSTASNMRNFQIAVDNTKSMGKIVNVSDPFPKYAHSLCQFLEAVGYKEALCELERIDSDFKSRSINLTKEHWDEATAICQHYKEFRGSIYNLFTSTANQYFPKFCDLYMKLLRLQRTQFDEETSSAIRKLAYVLEKHRLDLVIAAVLDPRFKMDIIQLWYNKIYGHDADYYLEKIMDDFTSVYKKYAKISESDSEDATTSYLDGMGRPCPSSYNMLFSSHKSSELERYLEDPKFPSIEKFDILAWWRAYTPIFPSLARMARDFLALPIQIHHSYAIRWCRFVNVINSIDCYKDLDHDIKLALMWLIADWQVVECKH